VLVQIQDGQAVEVQLTPQRAALVPPELVEQEPKVETPKQMEVLQILKLAAAAVVPVAQEVMQHLAWLVMVERVWHQPSPV
jgi:hypothetical protein